MILYLAAPRGPCWISRGKPLYEGQTFTHSCGRAKQGLDALPRSKPASFLAVLIAPTSPYPISPLGLRSMISCRPKTLGSPGSHRDGVAGASRTLLSPDG
jgi:hypothetical protein